MSNRMPSLLALLGLAAAAGYQNRDKLREMMSRATSDGTGRDSNDHFGEAGLQRQADTSLLGTMQDGLAELIERFTGQGDEATAKSWVSTGQNMAVTPDWLSTVLGDKVLADLSEKTGMTRVNLLSRLAQVLPETVDQLTPNGTINLPEPGVRDDFSGGPGNQMPRQVM